MNRILALTFILFLGCGAVANAQLITYSKSTSGGGGSGTVNSGTAGQTAYYASSGTAVSSTPLLTIGSSSVGIPTTSSLAFVGSTSLTPMIKFAGQNFLSADSVTNGSTYLGYLAGNNGAGNATFNTAFGYQALAANTTGNENSAFGEVSCASLTTANFATCIGQHAGGNFTTESSVTAISDDAARNWAAGTTGSPTNGAIVAIGKNAMFSGGGFNSVAIGFEPLQGNTAAFYVSGTPTTNDVITVTATFQNPSQAPTASYTVQAGDTLATITAGIVNAIDSNNTITGSSQGTCTVLGINTQFACYLNGTATSGPNKITFTVSFSVGATETVVVTNGNTGIDNIAIGYQAMFGANMTTAAENVCAGTQCFFGLTTGVNNVGLGKQVGNVMTTGSNNIMIGNLAGSSATTSSDDVIIGINAGTMTTTATGATIIGFQAGQNSTSSFLTVLGYEAGMNATVAGNGQNTGIGAEALFNMTSGGLNAAVGYLSSQGTTTGSSNTAFGWEAGATGNGSNVTSAGDRACNSLTTGGSSACFGAQVGALGLGTGGGVLLIGLDNTTTAPTSTTSNFMSIDNAVTANLTGTNKVKASNTAKIGIAMGTTLPLSTLDVNGGISVGAANAGVTTAPANGAIIQGSVGIGSTIPQSQLDVISTSTATSGSALGHYVYQTASPVGASSTGFTNIYSSAQYNSSSDNSAVVNGVKSVAELLGQGASNQVTGIYGIAQADANSGAYNATASLYGGRFQAIVNGTSTFNHVIGIKIDAPLINGTTGYTSGLYVMDQTNGGGSGTITTQDGIHIEGSGIQNAIGFGNGGSGINANIYSQATNQLLINGSSGIVLNSATTGGVSIGTTTINVSTLTVPSVSSFNTSTNLLLQSGNKTEVQIANTGDGTNSINIGGSGSGGTAQLFTAGGSSSVPLVISAKGTSGFINFSTNSVTNVQAKIINTTSSVDYLTMTGAASTASTPIISVDGTDTNQGISIMPKGSSGVAIGTTTAIGALNVAGTVKTLGYTVSALPSGTVGMRAYVTDQLTTCAVAGAALTGGGAVTCPVFYNGSAWVGD